MSLKEVFMLIFLRGKSEQVDVYLCKLPIVVMTSKNVNLSEKQSVIIV